MTEMTEMTEILLNDGWGGFRIHPKFIRKFNELNYDKPIMCTQYDNEDEQYEDDIYKGTTCLCVLDKFIDDESDIHGDELRLRTENFFVDLVKQNVDISVSGGNIFICQIPKKYFDSGCFKILNNDGVEVMQILTYKYKFLKSQKD